MTGRAAITIGLAAAALSWLTLRLESAPRPAAPSSAEFFAGRLPRGLPVPPVPGNNPISDAKARLGRRLFYDTRLSGNQTYSCGSCHQQAFAFTDGRPRALGSTGGDHPRSAMTLTNVAYNASFGWTNEGHGTLEAQMAVPMYNEHPVELGMKGRETEIISRFSANADDIAGFSHAFPDEPVPVTMTQIVKAIASFERTLLSGRSPFDRYLYEDDRRDMSPAALRGVTLFFSDRLGCSVCHNSFNLSGPVTVDGARAPTLAFHNTGLAPVGKTFRAPTLRNIAVTAPYMHDGRLQSLEDVIRHYSRFRHFDITPTEVSDLVAFLNSFTDEEFLANPAFADPHIK